MQKGEELKFGGGSEKLVPLKMVKFSTKRKNLP